MKNFKLIVEYDGTAYAGWQRQKSDPTIQGAIEKAVHRISRQRVTVHGSGRTDAGVHALGQTAHFECATRLDAAVLQKALNALLPKDIVIRDCAEAPKTFHARFDARAKTYRYRIDNRSTRPAIGRGYAWHIRKPLDLAAMAAALPHIRGTHDFKAFEGSGSPRSHTIRTVNRADLETGENGRVVFEVNANGFLRFMVRNLTGTLVEVGLGKLEPDEVGRILFSGDRRQAGATAPPHGLFLVEVQYE
ncbi:MAG: tRNA pseudouridine(38-40) synthase TruA [Desulfobacterales bacterium]